jgi:hypothetical protein
MDRALDETLSPYTTKEQKQIQRSLHKIGGKKVVILHDLNPVPEPQILHPMDNLVFGDPIRFLGEGFIFHEAGNPWAETGILVTNSFNCHAFALGERVGLTPRDWISSVASDATLNTNPMQILLDAYFEEVMGADYDPMAAMRLAEETSLKEDDVISFSCPAPGKNDLFHLHSGRITRVEDEWWIAGKAGAGRIIVAPILNTLMYYPRLKIPGKIRVYRFID